MAAVREIEQFLYTWAPRELAAGWDNVGLLVGDPDREVTRILVALDVTRAVADEAAQAACNLLYDSGVKVMWSFSSGPLYKPLDAVVQYENLALSLAHLKMQALDLPERRNV